MKHEELKKLAEAAAVLDHNEAHWWCQALGLLPDAMRYPKNVRFIGAASPDVVLGLLAEIEQLEFELRVEHSMEHEK